MDNLTAIRIIAMFILITVIGQIMLLPPWLMMALFFITSFFTDKLNRKMGTGKLNIVITKYHKAIIIFKDEKLNITFCDIFSYNKKQKQFQKQTKVLTSSSNILDFL